MYIESGDREICVLMPILYMNTYVVNLHLYVLVDVCTYVFLYVHNK